MHHQVVPVILCGGSGRRLWPLSRAGFPKQFLVLSGTASLFQQAVEYRSVMPSNLYGPGDNYHPENGHVIPALLRRLHEAKLAKAPEVVIWGSGQPKREFLFVDDVAAASVFVMGLSHEVYGAEVHSQLSHINVGFGSDVTIADLAPRKLMDSGRLKKLGWQPKVQLREGLVRAYEAMQAI